MSVAEELYVRTRSAISLETAAVSWSTANWAKISSSVGSDMRVRNLSMESSATSLPRWRISTCEQTRSTISNSCELNKTTLPRAASSWMSCRITRAEVTSSPEKGSSNKIEIGIVQECRGEQHLLPHTFRVRRDGDVPVAVKGKETEKTVDLLG